MSLEIKNLTIAFKEKEGDRIVVDDVSFSIEPGKMLALVGESGSGKTLTALSILGLLPPGARHTSGEIFFKGMDLLKESPSFLQTIRSKKISFIFQEPTSALNPLHTIYRQVSELFRIHDNLKEAEIREKVIELFHLVEFPEGVKRFDAYPHELSGGQRQRVVIAMALALEPEIVIADEPTTALDVTTQIGIIHFFQKLKEYSKTSFIFISHNLPLVSHVADHVCVMQKGKIVEEGTCESVFKNPCHEYTKRLMESAPQGSPLTEISAEKMAILHVDSLKASYAQKHSWFKKKKRERGGLCFKRYLLFRPRG